MNKHGFCRCQGFTLLELIVVIGIIGILASVTLGVFGGASDSAQAAKCMTNMRNLAVASYNYASANEGGNFPKAGSYEYFSTTYVREVKGWISWLNKNNVYAKGKTESHMSQPGWTPYNTYREGNKNGYDDARFALTNGAVWAYAGRTMETYVCPVHRDACRKQKLIPVWSYVMNSYFGYDYSQGSETLEWSGQYLSGLRSKYNNVQLGLDRVLLFAELPFVNIPSTIANVQNDAEERLEGEDAEHDCTLQYDDKTWSKPESIGFNHKSGKRYLAHVAFADGHVAKLFLPKDANETIIRDLTTWMCQGDEIAYGGSTYERVIKADEKTK